MTRSRRSSSAMSIPPVEACPVARPACDTGLVVSYHPPASDRRVVESVADGVALGTNDLGGAAVATGFAATSVCAASDCPSQHMAGAWTGLVLRWNATGATYRLEIPATARDQTAFDAFALRVTRDFQNSANSPRPKAQEVDVVLQDGSGARAAVRLSAWSEALFDPPGARTERHGVMNQAQIPLSAFAGVDLSDVRAVELVAAAPSTGTMVLSDVMFLRAP